MESTQRSFSVAQGHGGYDARNTRRRRPGRVVAVAALSDGPRRITGNEFRGISRLLHRHTGINLVAGKETLVMGRLDKRLRQLGLRTYGEYLHLLDGPDGAAELGQLVDLLTTNETYFFREP